MKRRIVLIVAQETGLRTRMAHSLGAAGYAVALAASVRRAGELLEAGGIEAAVVVPDGPGPAAAQLVAEVRVVLGRVVVWDGSARKFDEQELTSRIAVALAAPPDAAESGAAASPLLGFAGCALDIAGRALFDESGREVALTRNEFALLAAFVDNPGRVLSRERLRTAVAGEDLETYERSIDMLVSRLRRKVEPDPRAPRLIV
ncbi:MAG TPA: winged helix-turn-helix domain-containing protein, partial [Stellaceae bacterium]|nr:winged helix-turn-helix domain-containing protein [Stellaceae bacterium]